MRRLIFVLALLATPPSHAGEPARRRHASKRKPTPKPPPSPALEPAEPGKVPPGAQLTPNRVIEAPQAPGPDSSPGRVVEPAHDVTPKRDADRGRVQPPYPTGPDPGRNMQPATGLSPSSQPIVP